MGRQVRSGPRSAESREAAGPGRGHVDDAGTERGVDVVVVPRRQRGRAAVSDAAERVDGLDRVRGVERGLPVGVEERTAVRCDMFEERAEEARLAPREAEDRVGARPAPPT